MQDSVTINILGQEYKLRAGGDAERIQALSRYINDKVLEVQQHKNAVSTKELIVLVLLSLADDIFRTQTELETLRKEISGKVESLLEQIDTRI